MSNQQNSTPRPPSSPRPRSSTRDQDNSRSPPTNKNNNNDRQPSPKSNSNNEKPSQSRQSQQRSSSSSNSKSSKASSSSISISKEKAIIAGASAGAGLLLLLFIICCVCCCCRRRKRKQRRRNMQQFPIDNFNGPPRNHSNYYNSGNWANSGQQNKQELKPPPGAHAVSGEYGWSSKPPPLPPHMMHSTDMMNSANYSGPCPPAPPYPTMPLGLNQSSFSYDDLAAATGGFARSNLLGQGGFGYVHKGVLPNGTIVAVKSLKANSGQGEREFQAEVDIISRVHHRHLVSLVGYCITGSQRMLVYEFVANDTLESHIHGKVYPTMDWATRLRIALGSAKGFAYLHEDCHPRIIHRDIKAANILLDDTFEAKVADFGLAKLSADTNTHVSTRIMGTFGYLAPEYAASGKLTEKSDVYSYGVVLLELITGKRPVDIHSEDDSLVDWARPIMTSALEGKSSYDELADPFLEGNYDPQEMLRMIAAASACVRHSARRRPKMSKIVRALEGDASLDDLNEVVTSSQNSTCGSRRMSTSSDFDFKKSQTNHGLSSPDLSSGEYGNTTDFAR